MPSHLKTGAMYSDMIGDLHSFSAHKGMAHAQVDCLTDECLLQSTQSKHCTGRSVPDHPGTHHIDGPRVLVFSKLCSDPTFSLHEYERRDDHITDLLGAGRQHQRRGCHRGWIGLAAHGGLVKTRDWLPKIVVFCEKLKRLTESGALPSIPTS